MRGWLERLPRTVIKEAVRAGAAMGELLDRLPEKELEKYDGDKAVRILRKSAIRLQAKGEIVESAEVIGPKQLYLVNPTSQEEIKSLPGLLRKDEAVAKSINLEYVLGSGSMIVVDYNDEKQKRYAFSPTVEELEASRYSDKITREEAVEFVNWFGKKARIIR